MEYKTAPARPELAEQASEFVLLERAVEQEYRPPMRAELQRRVDALAQAAQATRPACPRCGQTMGRKDLDRCRGWPGLESSARRFRVSFVETAMCSAGPCWPCWAWNWGVSAVLWPDCWRYWRRWPPVRWQRAWQVAVGSGCRRDGRLGCGAAFRASGGGLRRGSQRVSCRQPQPGHGRSECAADRGVQRGWLRVENAGARTEAAPPGRGETAPAPCRCRRPFP
jgi:hypothetical protein